MLDPDGIVDDTSHRTGTSHRAGACNHRMKREIKYTSRVHPHENKPHVAGDVAKRDDIDPQDKLGGFRIEKISITEFATAKRACIMFGEW